MRLRKKNKINIIKKIFQPNFLTNPSLKLNSVGVALADR
jgi:hypothetical protein